MKILNRLFSASDQYLKKCRWPDIALLKFCLCSMGIFIGLCIPKEKHKTARIWASIVFSATYGPLMAKFLPILIQEFKNKDITDEK